VREERFEGNTQVIRTATQIKIRQPIMQSPRRRAKSPWQDRPSTSNGKMPYELIHDPKMVREYLRHSVISTTMDEYVGEVDSLRGGATEIIAQQLGLSIIAPRKATWYSRTVGSYNVNQVMATAKSGTHLAHRVLQEIHKIFLSLLSSPMY